MKKHYKVYSYHDCLQTLDYIKEAGLLEILLDTSNSRKSKIKYKDNEYIVDYCGCQVYKPEQLGSYTAIIYGEIPKEMLNKNLYGCIFEKD